MKQLAHLARFKKMHAANAHYGRACHWVSDAMHILPAYQTPHADNWWSIVSDGCEDFQEFIWVMRPNAIRACERLNWQPVIFSDPSEVSAENTFTEGLSLLIPVTIYERDKSARLACIQNYGNWKCQICGFDFAVKYGDIGRDFIHVHHLTLMSEHPGEYVVNPSTDLIPVCPNCHSMLHKKKPPYTPDELKEIISKLG